MPISITDLQSIERFAALDRKAIKVLTELLEEREYRPGQFVVYEGDPAAGLFIVLEGRVRLSRTAVDGREQVLDVVGKGEFFNVAPFVDAGPAPATVRAMAPLRCFHLAPAMLLPLLETQPDLMLLLLRDLAAQVRDLAVLLEDLAFRTVRERIARILLHEAADGTAALTHQELAARAGTVREIVGRTLRQMAQEGLVELARGQVLVLDMAGLKHILHNSTYGVS